MIPCPSCSMPMLAFWHPQTRTRPRVYCSRICRDQGIGWAMRDKQVDEMAVVRLLDGSRVVSNKAERIEAVRVLTERGRSAAWIADCLHTTARSIQRYRAELTNRKQAVA